MLNKTMLIFPSIDFAARESYNICIYNMWGLRSKFWEAHFGQSCGNQGFWESHFGKMLPR